MARSSWQSVQINDSTAQVMLYGASDSFAGLANATSLPSGHSFKAFPISGWGFGAGTAAFQTQAMPDGSIIIANTPQTDNPLQPTADHCELDIFDPTINNFYKITIPTSTGATVAYYNGRTDVGGTDIGDVAAVQVAGEDKVFFATCGYWFGWNPTTVGIYPVVGYLKKQAGQWIYDSAASKTSTQLRATNISAYNVIAPTQNFIWSTRVIAEVAVLPQSGCVVMGHYAEGNGYRSGLVSVVSADGNLLAVYQIPSLTLSDGVTQLTVHPREVQADPSSSLNDERFVVIYDVVDAGSDFTIQEFSYNHSTQTIIPKSLPIRSTEDDVRPETCDFDDNGNLYIANAASSNGLTNRNLSVFLKKGGERDLVTLAPIHTGWETDSWPTNVDPDYSLGGGAGIALVRSLTIDTGHTNAIMAGGVAGYLATYVPDADISSLGSNLIAAADSGFEVNNMLSANNSSFETSVAGWAGVSCTIAQSTTSVTPPNGTQTMKMTSTTTSSMSAGTALSGWVAVTVGSTYKAQAYVLCDNANAVRSCQVAITWFTSGAAVVSQSIGTAVTNSKTSWTQLNVTATAPATAAFAQVTVLVPTTVVGHIHYVDYAGIWQDTTISSNWTANNATLARDFTQSLDGRSSMSITASSGASSGATSSFLAVSPNREYMAKCWWKCDPTGSGTIRPVKVEIEWYTSGQSLISTSSGTITTTDSKTAWLETRCGAPSPSNAAYAKVKLTVSTTTINKVHYVDRVTLQAQPFTVKPQINLGFSTLQSSYPNIGPRQASISARRLFMPINNMLTTAEQATHPQMPISKPQWLFSIDLTQLLGS